MSSFLGLTISLIAGLAMFADGCVIFVIAIGGVIGIHWAFGFVILLIAPWIAAMLKLIEWSVERWD